MESKTCQASFTERIGPRRSVTSNQKASSLSARPWDLRAPIKEVSGNRSVSRRLLTDEPLRRLTVPGSQMRHASRNSVPKARANRQRVRIRESGRRTRQAVPVADATGACALEVGQPPKAAFGVASSRSSQTRAGSRNNEVNLRDRNPNQQGKAGSWEGSGRTVRGGCGAPGRRSASQYSPPGGA